MNKSEAKTRLNKLRETITDLRYRYHVLNDPEITDDIYDSLTRELRSIEGKFPDLRLTDDPINRVAGAPLDKFEKITHKERMLSLQDVFSISELEDWEERAKKIIKGETLSYFAELKFDGLAVSLFYENGKLVYGATRGDGFIGENITENIKMISDIPVVLPENSPKIIEVRGEIVMSKDTLVGLNKQNERDGKPKFANTRNAAAGSMRQLDPSIAKERNLSFFAYDIAQLSDDYNKKIKLHSDEHRLLLSLGFPVSEHEKKCKDIKDVEKFVEGISKIRESLPFGTDGVVISINETSLQKRLGVVGKAPRYMCAFKYPAEKATTKVLDITVQVGRTGVLTPLAHFEPTLVSGSTVSKATLHNMDQIERLDLKIGDTVVIQKAGDVIPEVVEVLKGLRTGKEKNFKMPSSCPVCGGEVEKKEGQGGKSVAYYCTNKRCEAKSTRGLVHFVNAFDIYTVGPKIIERLQDEGLITDGADLFTLTEADLSGLERFEDKSASNIVGNIKERRKPTLDRFIVSLGIIHVGEETARDLAGHFGTLKKFLNAKESDLDEIENIGPAVTESILEYLSDEYHQKFVQKLIDNDVKPKEYKKATGKFTGLTFVLTGTLPTLSREEAKKIILDNGGKVASSVSKTTSFVLAGESAGSKLNEANKLGVKVISEAEFVKMGMPPHIFKNK